MLRLSSMRHPAGPFATKGGQDERAHAGSFQLQACSAPVSGKASATARLLGSATSGILELLGFHPVDTVAKRLMSNKGNIKGANFGETMSNMNTVIFRDAASAGLLRKYTSLFPGLGFAAGYKVLQRVYKFGGQPFVRDLVEHRFGDDFYSTFGPQLAKPLMHSFAGSMIGIGEVVLLPLDVLKIKAQTNPDTLRGRGVMDLFMKEGRNLYRGAGWTMARNAPGSFALFGGSALTMEGVFKLKNYKDATFGQTFVASIAGAAASITVASPLDVVKTRIQNRPFDAPESGVRIISNMVRQEGFGSFFKGLLPKLVVVGPKLVFSFTVAQYLISKLDHVLPGMP